MYGACSGTKKKATWNHGWQYEKARNVPGPFKGRGKLTVKSNAESGVSYSDILLIVPPEKIGCVIEVKYAENGGG